MADAPVQLREGAPYGDKIPIIGLGSLSGGAPLAVLSLSGSTVVDQQVISDGDVGLMLYANTECRWRWSANLADATDPDQDSIPLPAGMPFFCKFPGKAVIRAVKQTNADNGKLWIVRTW